MDWYSRSTVPVDHKGKKQNFTGVLLRRRGQKNIIVALCLIGLIFLVLAGYSRAQKKVTVCVEDKKIKVQTFKKTVGEVLQEKNIPLKPQDKVTPATFTFLNDGLKIVIRQAVPVTVTVNGRTQKYWVYPGMVAEVLESQGVSLGKNDLVRPPLTGVVRAGAQIKVTRVVKKEAVKEIELAFNTQRETNPNLPRGFTQVSRAGRSGLEKQKWQITYHDGREVERCILARTIVLAPKDRVLQVGTKKQVTVSRSGQGVNSAQEMTMLATAYTHTGNNTASGVPPRYGTVAVDPRVIPLGTRLYIEGYGYAVAQDIGPAIKGNRVDVFFETGTQARQWGIRSVKVKVLR
ncbi:MAG TPA: hypothetical protein DCK87_08785 [Desulfotomaculum sp.]|nr:hypothetical protein [Desulfotomaculum sp.]